ncbi:MAG: hypothetical protein U0359_14755 [Byssovorax sp.]
MRRTPSPTPAPPAVRRLALPALVTGVALTILIPSCGGDNPSPVGKYQGSTPDARNYCAIVGACGLFPDFGFGECMNQIARSEIELAPFGGDLGQKERYTCVKNAGTDCAAAQQCVGRITTQDPRCSDPSLGSPFGNQPRSFCDDDRITVCDEMGPGSTSFNCADDFAKQQFGGPYCVKNADASALCGYTACPGFDPNNQGGGPPAGDGGNTQTYPDCKGNTLYYCTNGVEQRENCSAFGGTCNAVSGKCEGTCEPKGTHCEGTELVRDCASGTALPLYDCSARNGWTCQPPEDSTSFGCVPPDKECAWGTYQAECVEGVKIRFCDDGKLNLYDCRDVGATACVPTATGVNCKL